MVGSNPHSNKLFLASYDSQNSTMHHYIFYFNSTVTYHFNPVLIRGIPAGEWCIGCAYTKLMRAKPVFANRKEGKTFVP